MHFSRCCVVLWCGQLRLYVFRLRADQDPLQDRCLTLMQAELADVLLYRDSFCVALLIMPDELPSNRGQDYWKELDDAKRGQLVYACLARVELQVKVPRNHSELKQVITDERAKFEATMQSQAAAIGQPPDSLRRPPKFRIPTEVSNVPVHHVVHIIDHATAKGHEGRGYDEFIICGQLAYMAGQKHEGHTHKADVQQLDQPLH